MPPVSVQNLGKSFIEGHPVDGIRYTAQPPALPQAPQMPQMPKAPQAPQAPQMPQAPQAPKPPAVPHGLGNLDQHAVEHAGADKGDDCRRRADHLLQACADAGARPLVISDSAGIQSADAQEALALFRANRYRELVVADVGEAEHGAALRVERDDGRRLRW